MSIFSWLLLGLIAGFFASKLITGSGRGILIDMVLGLAGAFVGRAMAQLLGRVGNSAFDVASLAVAFGGAVLVLMLFHAATQTRQNDGPRPST